jgi:hypothetical protein
VYAAANTAAAVFTVTNLAAFFAANGAKGAGSTITTQSGLEIADQTNGTNNYGITSLVSSGTNKWNIYASGTAQNYFAGNVGVGIAVATANLEVAKGSEGTYLKVGGDNSGSNSRALTFTSSTTGGSNGALHTISASSVSGVLAFATGSSERMRITSTGNLGIGTSSPSASAILDAQSTTKGVRMPNMTTTQKNAIASPAAGLMVFDTTLAKLCVYSGAAWETITSV